MELKKLSSKTAKALSLRHKDEYKAHYTYQYIAQCFKNKGYYIAAEYFYKEAEDELNHAKMLELYAAQWNTELDFLTIDSPDEIEGIEGALEYSYKMELDLLNSYKSTTMETFEDGELEHFIFLQQFVDIQNKAVGEYADKLNMLDLFDRSNPSWVLQFEKKLFK